MWRRAFGTTTTTVARPADGTCCWRFVLDAHSAAAMRAKYGISLTRFKESATERHRCAFRRRGAGAGRASVLCLPWKEFSVDAADG